MRGTGCSVDQSVIAELDRKGHVVLSVLACPCGGHIREGIYIYVYPSLDGWGWVDNRRWKMKVNRKGGEEEEAEDAVCSGGLALSANRPILLSTDPGDTDCCLDN